MNNFTPEYIELCKNSKVQGLKEKLKLSDNVCIADIKGSDVYTIIFASVRYGEDYYRIVKSEKDKFYRCGFRNKFIWLPTGDQLDEEITKISSERGLYYTITHTYSFAAKDWSWTTSTIPEGGSTIITNSNNPLTAKILLIIQLLENNV